MGRVLRYFFPVLQPFFRLFYLAGRLFEVDFGPRRVLMTWRLMLQAKKYALVQKRNLGLRQVRVTGLGREWCRQPNLDLPRERQEWSLGSFPPIEGSVGQLKQQDRRPGSEHRRSSSGG